MDRKKYKFICYEDRVKIAECIKEGFSQAAIARVLGISNSAISLEYQRAGVNVKGYYPDGRIYDPDDAQRKLRR